jgi:AhpC/TSA family
MEEWLMRYTVMGVLALLVLVPTAWARDDAKDKPKPDQKQTPAEEFRSLVKDFATKQQEVRKAYQAAKTDEERNKAFANWPKPQDYTGKVLKLAQDNPKDAFVPEALVWVVQQARFGPEANKALDILLADHAKSEKLKDICQSLRYSGSPQAEKHLRSILEKSPHKDVQGTACLVLGQYLRGQTERPGLKDDAREKLAKEAETFLERAAEQYGDVKMYNKTIGDLAKAELFETRHLVIGKEAPEIEGEDIDGKKFKLSDYRGKVVVLDFWGNW